MHKKQPHSHILKKALPCQVSAISIQTTIPAAYISHFHIKKIGTKKESQFKTHLNNKECVDIGAYLDLPFKELKIYLFPNVLIFKIENILDLHDKKNPRCLLKEALNSLIKKDFFNKKIILQQPANQPSKKKSQQKEGSLISKLFNALTIYQTQTAISCNKKITAIINKQPITSSSILLQQNSDNKKTELILKCGAKIKETKWRLTSDELNLPIKELHAKILLGTEYIWQNGFASQLSIAQLKQICDQFGMAPLQTDQTENKGSSNKEKNREIIAAKLYRMITQHN